MREFGECMHKEFTTGQILGFVDPDASTQRVHGHSIEKGVVS